MPLEELIRDINADGFHVSNLFQQRDHSWQANLRTAGGFLQQEYGCGSTPYLALMEALTKMQEAPKAKKVLGVASVQTGSSLLASLGLKKPAVAT